MRSNYKKLGNYIREVNVRNSTAEELPLLGINIDKFFMPSVANIVGTDLSSYKLVKTNQFACNKMHVGRDERLPVALSNSPNNFIVSPAYDVFEIIDPDILLPEYLMIWFSRREYDRNAWFYTDADVRGGLHWDAFCEMTLPIPHPDKQKEIIKEYNTILNRINHNNLLIQKLEETAQAIYKQWFVDFEFPDENGNPHKSSGGEMEFNKELEKEIPNEWIVGELNEITIFKNGKVKPDIRGKYPVYGGNGILDYVDDYNFENIIAIGRVGAYCGSLYRVEEKCWISDNAISAESKNNFNMFCFHLLNNLELNARSEGTSQPLLTQGILGTIRTILPKNNVIELFEYYSSHLFKKLKNTNSENELLGNLKDLLLSKLATIEN